MISLEDFLEQKTLYYDKIDYDAISNSWDILKDNIKMPYVIHIVGTNGKGTTGRFLSSFLHQQNKKVLHYTSPHIIKFNERIWIDGKDSDNNQLQEAHSKLQKILTSNLLEKLTYFEYTTLLAIYISSNFDYLVLEAGLGGEFDATNVVENNLSIFTTIGLDHQNFLGNSLEEIASTKMRSCNNNYILGEQISSLNLNSTKEVLKNKNRIELDNNLKLNQDISKLAPYLKSNLNLALSVLKYLNLFSSDLKIDKLSGRFEYLKSNIIIDVGHNPLAASVILETLQKENKKVILIYNSYADKDYKEVLTILKPIIKHIEIIECNDNRIVDKNILENTIDSLEIKREEFDIRNLKDNLNYLIFGSFLVVESFLNSYKVQTIPHVATSTQSPLNS